MQTGLYTTVAALESVAEGPARGTETKVRPAARDRQAPWDWFTKYMLMRNGARSEGHDARPGSCRVATWALSSRFILRAALFCWLLKRNP